MLLHELVKTASMQVALWQQRRELRHLQRQFPPRVRRTPFWPALLLLVAGAALFVRAQRAARLEAARELLVPLPGSSQFRTDGTFLAVVSDPLGAQVELTWPGGSKSGTTPFDLEVPRGAQVHAVFSKGGASFATDVVAGEPQVVKGILRP